MESIIKWQTGEPKERGYYLVTLTNNKVELDEYCGIIEDELGWFEHEEDEIIAWCKLSDIKPYKEEEL